MHATGTVSGNLSNSARLSAALSSGGRLSGGLTVPTHMAQSIYDGATEFTPSSETQVISTADKLLLGDIIINPVPSNYGLIEWNGSSLSVR